MNLTTICIIGMGTVFLGLILLIYISYLMSFICKLLSKPEAESKPEVSAAQMPRKKPASVPAQATPIANKQELVAGICAVIAEELGTDVSNIRVTSFKKL